METKLLELLKDLIVCKPVTADVAAVNRVTAVMRNFLLKHNVRCVTETLDGREILYASALPEGNVSDVLFNAHLDVVPAIEEKQYVPEIRDGKLYARGSSDCLAHAVIIAGLLARLNGKVSAAAVFTTDEETGGFTTRAMVERGYRAQKGAIILDSCLYRIAYAQKGILSVKLTAHGKGGHASQIWSCDNPIDKLCRAYVKFASEWTNPPADAQWGDTMTPCIVEGGKVSNQVPDSASMVLNIRYVDDSHYDEIMKKLRGTGLDVETVAQCPPVVSDENNDFIAGLQASAEAVLGRKMELFRMNGATDARHLKAMNVPIVISGSPGGGCHCLVEYVELDKLPQTIALYERFLTHGFALK